MTAAGLRQLRCSAAQRVVNIGRVSCAQIPASRCMSFRIGDRKSILNLNVRSTGRILGRVGRRALEHAAAASLPTTLDARRRWGGQLAGSPVGLAEGSETRRCTIRAGAVTVQNIEEIFEN